MKKIYSVLLMLLFCYFTFSNLKAEELNFNENKIFKEISQSDGLKKSEEGNFYYEKTTNISIEKNNNVNNAIIEDVTIEKEFFLLDNGISPKSNTGHDSSYSVKATTTVSYSTETKLGKTCKKIIKHSGSWKILDKTVRIDKRKVFNAMTGTYVYKKMFLPGGENNTYYPEKNTYSYSPKYKWYNTYNLSAGGWAEVKLKRGSSTWTFTISD